MSATVETLDDRIIPYIKNICKRDPFTGKVVTGGIVSVKDSSWLLSWTINRQPQFKTQPKGHCLVWVYGLFSDKPGGMEAVYTLLNVDRGVPEVWGSVYDLRALLDATVKLRDGKKVTDMDLGLIERLVLKEALKKIEHTDIEKLLKEYNVI